MKYLASHNIFNPMARRTAALLCAVLAGFGLTGRVCAQVTGPVTGSPPTPTPFQAPVFHSGGGYGATYPIDTASAPYLDPLLDPLQGQLQGTPSEIYPATALGIPTQIPSFQLGNFDPTRPPTGLQQTGVNAGVNIYYPNHFADGTILPWAAPFVYTPEGAGSVAVDDANNATPATFTGGVATASGFTATASFVPITNTTTFPAAGTATGLEYLRLPPATDGSAVWTLYEPAAGNYSLYYHIPNDLPDVNGVAEPRDTQVAYAIVVRDAAGAVTLRTAASASQTEANDSQFLAGPFQIASGGSVTVSLTRKTTVPYINYNPNQPYFLVADSLTLQPTIGDIRSTPTAITRNRFPAEFASTTHPLQYWGIYIPPGANVAGTGATPSAQATTNANPDTTGAAVNPTGSSALPFNSGNILLHSGNQIAALDPNAAQDPLRLIRQLVYFGRSDPSSSVSSSVDDSSTTNFTGGGTSVTNTTATGGEYLSSPAVQGLLTAPVATWTIPAPAGGTGGYFVYAHIPANQNGEVRLSQVYYAVTVNGVTTGPFVISQVTAGTDALVLLPTGALQAAAGSNIVVSLYAQNDSTTAVPPANSVVVADSVTVSAGAGQTGAIYCVDGFTGSVVWRFQTPGSANGASAPVFSSPAVARINVVVTPPVYGAGGTITTPAVYASRLVVIVGDDNGLVYCLDAIGNGDGTSNVNVLAKDSNGSPIPGQPNTIPQPAYAPGVYGAAATPLVPGTLATTAAATAHVGTTGVYWIYRPDVNRPKYVTGLNIGKIKSVDPTTDLPVPAAFSTASPNIFVDPTISTTAPTKSNSIVYVGNSNGVLYALDGGGAPVDGTLHSGGTTDTFDATGDTFNVSQDIQPGTFPKVVIPSAQPLWWFSLRGVDPNGVGNTSSADIESAPAISVKATGTGAGTTYHPTVYIGSAHEQEATSNIGRLYALDGVYGPSGNGGRLNPVNNTPTAANYGGPGAFNYNVGQVPQISKTDTADWSFPDANNTTTGPLTGYAHASIGGRPRPALGNITGSPVVFTNTDETAAAVKTRLYFAASSGQEYPQTTRPDDTQTGRLWAVNLDGTVGHTVTKGTGGNVWSYPLANDPNDPASDIKAEPVAPIGSFLRATPAIGYVQFPNVILNGDGTNYAHPDAVRTALQGQPVPMLYVGTRGVNDTALYAIDIDGDQTATTDGRDIYRLISPSGSIYQSSPALVTNATINNTGTGGTNNGNGGAVYITAGNTLYDYSATPITNPNPGDAFTLVRLNRSLVGVGPISSPALAGADITDLSTAFLASGNATPGLTNTSGFLTNTQDWVYVGDSSSGFCRGITSSDVTYGGIAVGLDRIVPYDPTAPTPLLLTASIQTFLVGDKTSVKSTDALKFGPTAPLPVYDWGDSAALRFSNVVPPNPKGLQSLYVYDHRLYPDLTQASATNPIPFYTSDGTTAQSVTFNLSDVDATSGSILQVDNGTVQPNLIVAPATPPDGYVVDQTTAPKPPFQDVTTNLADSAGHHYLGTYTYTIGDGSNRNNTPGARRRVQNVRQVVTEYDFDGTNYKQAPGTVIIGGDATAENLASIYDPTTKQYTFTQNSRIPAIDQPTFGILNPLGVRGGGVPVYPANSVSAFLVGEELGPFRSVDTSQNALPTFAAPGTGDVNALQALTNGNDVLEYAPPSSSGVGGDPTKVPNATTDPLAPGPFTTKVVVTTTGLIPHNHVGDNSEPVPSIAPTGTYSGTSDGLITLGFGGYSLNAFDRSALFSLAQTLRLKAGIPPALPNAPQTGRDGIFWNSNAPNGGAGVTGHDSAVNYLPWETPPTPYSIGINASLDYPDIAAGNVTQNAVATINSASPGDLTSDSVTLPQGSIGGGQTQDAKIKARTVYGDPVQIKITVPHYQPANQQLYQQNGGGTYFTAGEISPVNVSTGKSNITASQAFPMGYVSAKRLFVPSASGQFGTQRAYRIVRVYTGVPVDMQTSIANPTTDVGQVPAAFGVQTEQYTPTVNPPYPPVNPPYPLGFFTPYSPYVNNPNLPNPFLNYFKPLTVHNDGNVNLLNVHFDQKYANFNNSNISTLLLNSDAVDPLSALLGYDIAPGSTSGITGPRPTPELPFLIRTPLDTDLVNGTLGRNPLIANDATLNAQYPGATFHKPLVGSDQPSTLTVPDAPESYTLGASLDSSPTPQLPPTANQPNQPTYKSLPFVSLAIPFGTPVGTYSTPAPQSPLSLRLFEGLDPATATAYNTTSVNGFLFPPQYRGGIGGIGKPDTTQPVPDTYTAGQPLSTTGTQLTATVIEQRLTDGSTYGAVPMIDAVPAGTTTSNGTMVPASTPDFAPAAYRDPATGNLSVYWTSAHKAGAYGIYGANLPFILDPATNDPKFGHFMPTNPAGQWWQPFTPSLMNGTNSGLSVTTTSTGTDYAFAVNVANSGGVPYSNTLYSYAVTPGTGVLGTTPVAVTPAANSSQVKYGIKGLYTGTSFASGVSSLWAFWTANTRGRTALYYNPQSAWGTTTPPTLLPVPAGLTAVTDASPLLMTAPVTATNGTTTATTYTPTIEVTYSGTGPDGNADLYVSRYQPHGTTAATGAAQLDLVPFPAVTENLKAQGNTGWYQGRDTAWSRSGALNVSAVYKDVNGQQNMSLLYGAATPFAPKFTKAIYDKASGYLVLTGVQVPIILATAGGTQAYTTNTVYVDAATGRVRFSPALIKATQNFGAIQATFSPLARRLTTDTRADVAPVTFLDDTPKPNDAAGVPNSLFTVNVNAGRRWTIWRKAGVPGLPATATLYDKTQRLTLFLPTSVTAAHPTPSAIDVTQPITITFAGSGTAYTGPVDVDYLRGRLYFPVNVNQTAPLVPSQMEGQQVKVTYTDTNGQAHNGTTLPAVTDTVQWQDEQPANGQTQSSDILPTDSVSGLDTVIDTLVPIQTATNENNVAAFLDPYAGTPAAYGGLNPHKVWLFWNSTRNGTADIYSETIDPRFAPSPTIP